MLARHKILIQITATKYAGELLSTLLNIRKQNGGGREFNPDTVTRYSFSRRTLSYSGTSKTTLHYTRETLFSGIKARQKCLTASGGDGKKLRPPRKIINHLLVFASPSI